MKSISSKFNQVAAVAMAVVATMSLAVPAISAADVISDRIEMWQMDNFTVRLTGPVTIESATKLNRELLYLDANNPQNRDITLLINSGGGSVDQGFAIIDTIKSLKSDVRTICWGQCASMSAFILSSGTPGKRSAIPNAALMYHQPRGGCTGPGTDMQICNKDVQLDKIKMTEMLSAFSGLPKDQLREATERDWYMKAEEAKAYGLIDFIQDIPKNKPAAAPSRRIPDDVMYKITHP